MSDNKNDDLPSVAGRTTMHSLANIERKCLICIRDEQNNSNPNNFLIDTLCEAVRSIREYVDYVKNDNYKKFGDL